MKLAIKTVDIEPTITSLKAIDEASISDLTKKYISSTKINVRYEKLSKNGDYAPDNQQDGKGYWVKKSNPFYLVDNSYDFTANNAMDKSQDLILIRDYARKMCNDALQFIAFGTEQLDVKTWANCSNDEKKFLIDWNVKETSTLLVDDLAAKKAYLESVESMTTQEALDYLGQRFADFVERQKESCRQRIESKDLSICISKYLSPLDMRTLTAKVKEEYSNFNDYGYKELIYFIESINGYEADGLTEQGYTLNTGTINDFKDKLLTILKLGNYGKN